MISRQLEDRSQHHQLLQELIRHTERNKKWIEEHTPAVPQQRYQALAQEAGIADRIRARSGSEKNKLESLLAEEWGSLASNSSKKHAQVYI